MGHTVLLDSTQAGGVCPNPTCGHPLIGGERYCIYCGTEIAQGSNAGQGTEDNRNAVCYKCGNSLYPDERFCTQCGADQWERDKDNKNTVNIVGYCNQCSASLFEGDTHCRNCGCPVGFEPTPPILSNPSDDCCPVCGNPLPSGVTKCPVCETRVDDDENVRSELVILTYAEARQGCRKMIMVDGRPVTVDVPPGTTVYTHVDIAGLGYENKRTGARGPLRVSFHPK